MANESEKTESISLKWRSWTAAETNPRIQNVDACFSRCSLWEAIRGHYEIEPRPMKPGELSNDAVTADPRCRVMISLWWH